MLEPQSGCQPASRGSDRPRPVPCQTAIVAGALQLWWRFGRLNAQKPRGMTAHSARIQVRRIGTYGALPLAPGLPVMRVDPPLVAAVHDGPPPPLVLDIPLESAPEPGSPARARSSRSRSRSGDRARDGL